MATQINDSNFDSLVTKAEGVVFVDFWAPWCGPCRSISPVIDELSEIYKDRVQIYKMNVDENQVTPGKFAVRAIPTMMIFKNGELKEQIVGGVTKDHLVTAIEKVLA